MKVWIVSDLHLEFGLGSITKILSCKPSKADVLVIAGDLNLGVRIVEALEHLSLNLSIPIVYVLGNHDFYHENYTKFTNYINRKKVQLKKKNIFILNRDVVNLGEDVIFIGVTGWTDGSYMKNNPLLKLKGLMINDFKYIEGFSNADGGQDWGKKDAEFLRKSLIKYKDKKCVVVTHHAPTTKSLHPMYRGDDMNTFFINDWSDMILDYKPELWVHGHCHRSFTYIIGETMVMCNPYGYDQRDVNSHFNPCMICEILVNENSNL